MFPDPVEANWTLILANRLEDLCYDKHSKRLARHSVITRVISWISKHVFGFLRPWKSEINKKQAIFDAIEHYHKCPKQKAIVKKAMRYLYPCRKRYKEYQSIAEHLAKSDNHKEATTKNISPALKPCDSDSKDIKKDPLFNLKHRAKADVKHVLKRLRKKHSIQNIQKQIKIAQETLQDYASEISEVRDILQQIDTVDKLVSNIDNSSSPEDLDLSLEKLCSMLEAFSSPENKPTADASAAGTSPAPPVDLKGQIRIECWDLMNHASPAEATRPLSQGEFRRLMATHNDLRKNTIIQMPLPSYLRESNPKEIKEDLLNKDKLISVNAITSCWQYCMPYVLKNLNNEHIKTVMQCRHGIEPGACADFLQELNEQFQLKVPKISHGCGLSNLGNSCYLNSAIQFMRAIPDLEKIAELKSLASPIANKLYNIFCSFSKNITPPQKDLEAFLHSAKKSGWANGESIYTQQDATEFLRFILETLRPLKEVRCNLPSSTNIKNARKSKANNVDALIEKGYSPIEAELIINHPEKKSLTSFKAQEIFDLQPLPYDTCPSYFVQSFNRFENMRNNWSKDRRKLHIEIDYKDVFNIDALDNSKQAYQATALILHSGGSGGGHYTAMLRHGNDKWYLYNDSTVRLCRGRDLEKAKKQLTTILWTKKNPR